MFRVSSFRCWHLGPRVEAISGANKGFMERKGP